MPEEPLIAVMGFPTGPHPGRAEEILLFSADYAVNLVKCSEDTGSRDINDLIARGLLIGAS